MNDILQSGGRGPAVGALQTQLVKAGYLIEVTGIFDAATETAVRALQRMHGLVMDGKVGDKTRAALGNPNTSRQMRESDFVDAAERLGVSPACIKAVNSVESNGAGFLPDGRPCILFERHVFYDRLRVHGADPALHAVTSPDIVDTRRGGYTGGAAEHARLAAAVQICRPAALESASWGAFQIMGLHWRRLGHESSDAFVAAQHRSEGAQLAAFVKFIETDPALHKALVDRKWAVFARRYNGPAYAENNYDVKLERAYECYAAKGGKAVA